MSQLLLGLLYIVLITLALLLDKVFVAIINLLVLQYYFDFIAIARFGSARRRRLLTGINQSGQQNFIIEGVFAQGRWGKISYRNNKVDSYIRQEIQLVYQPSDALLNNERSRALLTIFTRWVSQKVVPTIKPKIDLIADLELNRVVLTIVPTLRLYSREIHRQLNIIAQVLL